MWVWLGWDGGLCDGDDGDSWGQQCLTTTVMRGQKKPGWAGWEWDRDTTEGNQSNQQAKEPTRDGRTWALRADPPTGKPKKERQRRRRKSAQRGREGGEEERKKQHGAEGKLNCCPARLHARIASSSFC